MNGSKPVEKGTRRPATTSSVASPWIGAICGIALVSTAVACDEAGDSTGIEGVEPDAAITTAPDGRPPQGPDAGIAAEGRSDSGFILPIHADDRDSIHSMLVIGMDHDPTSDGRLDCRSYQDRGFPTCYDGHDGTDFMIWGGFETIDVRDVRVVAAASGEVIRADDSHYDRCHGDFARGDVSCDGHPMRANRVHLRHRDGTESRYLHLKRDSLRVRRGDVVECGQTLALVGSSGRSTAPHTHFQVIDVDGMTVDPFAGPVTGPKSLWVDQVAEDGLPGSACRRAEPSASGQ